jgi:hypothetical protein
MKNSLLYILVFSALILFSCKKEAEVIVEQEIPSDPWDSIDFVYVFNENIKLDTNNNIVEYTRINSTYKFFYQGYTTASIDNITDSDEYDIYFLNNLGFADSSNYTDYSYGSSPSMPLFIKSNYQYSQGFITQLISAINGNSYSDTIHYLNDGNNITTSTNEGIVTNYIYADTLSKVDIWDLDNEFTGKNNKNLIKQIINTGTPTLNNFIIDTYYYYILNTEGYVTSYYTKRVDRSHNNNTVYYRYNFTYEFE